MSKFLIGKKLSYRHKVNRSNRLIYSLIRESDIKMNKCMNHEEVLYTYKYTKIRKIKELASFDSN